MSKLSNLLERDKKIVEKRKIIFLIPVCLVVFALIMGIVFHFTAGSALNLGMDFAGGYTIDVNVGANLTEDNTDEYKKRVTDIVEGYKYTDEAGEEYSIKVKQILTTGSGDDTSLEVRFLSVADDETMDKLVNEVVAELDRQFKVAAPSLSHGEGSTIILKYNMTVNQLKAEIEDCFKSVTGASNIEYDGKTVKFAYSGTLSDDEIVSKMTIPDKFVARSFNNGKIGATVSLDLLYNAISAILIALVLMLIYIAIRFEFKSGIAAIVALIHDIAVMFMFMVIFHVEFNSTFIAALITILGYSINSTIILFDRVRSNQKMFKNMDKVTLANKSITQSFVRNLNTTITTLIMIGSVAVVCAIASIFNPDLMQMVVFALPIIVGLLAGFYSSMFIAPSVWVSLGAKDGLPKQKPVAEAEE